MAVISQRSAGMFVRDDDEGLFSRDLDGHLVRLDAPTQSDYDKQVTLESRFAQFQFSIKFSLKEMTYKGELAL